MSIYAYLESKKYTDCSFDVLLFSLIRKADDINLAKLRLAYPEEVEEFYIRYNIPNGILPDELLTYSEMGTDTESVTEIEKRNETYNNLQKKVNSLKIEYRAKNVY